MTIIVMTVKWENAYVLLGAHSTERFELLGCKRING